MFYLMMLFFLFIVFYIFLSPVFEWVKKLKNWDYIMSHKETIKFSESELERLGITKGSYKFKEKMEIITCCYKYRTKKWISDFIGGA